LLDHSELFVPAQGTLVGEDLHAHLGIVAVHVRDRTESHFVNEPGSVLPHHGYVWDALHLHHC